MSTKRPNDSDDDNFFDDDLFDSDLFENDDDSVVVHRPASKLSEDDNLDEEDSIFDSLIERGVAERGQSASAPQLDDQKLFDEDYTEVIMDDDVELPNTYLTDEQGKVFHVRRTPFLIGRSKECDLVINVKGVSRKHAELTFGAGHFVIRDLDSLNGTRVNGTPIPQIRLTDADVIQLGQHKFSFFTDTTLGVGRGASGGGVVRTHAQRNTPVGRSLPSQVVTQDVVENTGRSARQNTSDLLVKVNFVIVACIILVTLGYVIWEDVGGNEEEQQRLMTEQTQDVLQVPPLPTDKNILSLDGDWTQNGNLPPLDEDLEQIAKAVEAEMKGARLRMRDENQQNDEQAREELNGSEDQKQIEADVQAIKVAAAEEKARQARIEAEEAEEALEQKSVRDSNEAQSLLGSMRSAYISGDQLTPKLKRMLALSNSNALNGRKRRELRNTHDVYKSFVDQFNAGNKLFNEDKTDQAFQIWQQLLTQEKKVIGDETSYFNRKISDRAIDMTAEKARIADENGDFSQALKLYQKLVNLRPEGPYKSKIEQLLVGAEEKFVQAEKVMSSDPGKAVRMLQSVMDATPRDHPLHIRAESKLVWLKEGL